MNEVKILNRQDALGERLANAHVTIDGKDFGFLPSETATGEWYVLKSKSGVVGGSITVSTTDNTWLQIADIQVFGTDSADREKEPFELALEKRKVDLKLVLDLLKKDILSRNDDL